MLTISENTLPIVAHGKFTDDKKYQLQSNGANSDHLTAKSDSNYPAFLQSTQYHMVVRSKACEERGGV